MNFQHAGPLAEAASGLANATDRLPTHSVYRSVEARREYLEFYDRIIARLNMPVRGVGVTTRYGHTHLLMGGKREAKPLLLLPGMSICAPMMLEFFEHLAETRLLIAPDCVGQPGLSADIPFDPRDQAYGKWLLDVLDELGIDEIDMIGPSFGGSIALDLAAIDPKRVGKLALITTAGVTPRIPIVTAFTPLFVTWYAYRLFPHRPWLKHIARPMCRNWSPRNLDYLDLVIRTTTYWRHRPAGPFKEGQFKQALRPVFIAFSGRDHLLPFEATREHARKTLPIAQEMVMPLAAHMPSAEDIAPVEPELRKFFA